MIDRDKKKQGEEGEGEGEGDSKEVKEEVILLSYVFIDIVLKEHSHDCSIVRHHSWVPTNIRVKRLLSFSSPLLLFLRNLLSSKPAVEIAFGVADVPYCSQCFRLRWIE